MYTCTGVWTSRRMGTHKTKDHFIKTFVFFCSCNWRRKYISYSIFFFFFKLVLSKLISAQVYKEMWHFSRDYLRSVWDEHIIKSSLIVKVVLSKIRLQFFPMFISRHLSHHFQHLYAISTIGLKSVPP